MNRSPLPLLIRRAKFTVDERRAELTALVDHETQAQAAVTAHDALLAEEQSSLSQRSPDAMLAYTAWLHHHRRRRENLADRWHKLTRSREAALDALREACADLKRLELADDARREAAKRSEAKRVEAKSEEAVMIRRHHDTARAGSAAG
jgi:hypothetical protein